MFVLVPISYCLLTTIIWGATVIQSQRLYLAYTARFPEEARAHIPYAASSMRPPGKFLFFLRKGAVPLLQRDPRIWRMRQRLVALMVLSLTFPPVGMLAIAAVVVTLGQ